MGEYYSLKALLHSLAIAGPILLVIVGFSTMSSADDLPKALRARKRALAWLGVFIVTAGAVLFFSALFAMESSQ